ncbi:acid phosphatase 1 [Cucurbita pepo subsp. pepo]|uniref:acid phosphatase 1 n=1 Tax=Cucurbita pepo subsp. pepo TaxID=3664 RepID=UPI000C9DA248|nr:acid phosphatase 1 [Cucurbita pepo subsp. pepo]
MIVIGEMVRRAREIIAMIIFAVFSSAAGLTPPYWNRGGGASCSHCLSWRLAAETNNVEPWRTVPAHCCSCVGAYITGGQYQHDLRFVVEQILTYADEIPVAGDGLDAWILDVDDTCISNVDYYKSKRYGCEPYDPAAFRSWAMEGECPAIQSVAELFAKLIESGFKVFLVTGRDEENLGQVTSENLHREGFVGYERLILRSAAEKGRSAVEFKTEVRRRLVEQGYRIWGNVGDQWSDLRGAFVGNRTFKLPNPMYFVP